VIDAAKRNTLSFDPYELSIGNRLLTHGTEAVPLGSRATNLLVVLVEQANQGVSQRTLIERVWPKRGADQVSLRVHISALRKSLAERDPSRRYIATVPGRGYSFIVPVALTIAGIQTELTAHKFITIVGPGASARPPLRSRLRMRCAPSSTVRSVSWT
jgi:DNA-binding winged helix-turn-helix (wHTH) protein